MIELLYMFFAGVTLYVSMSCEYARKGFVGKGEDDTAKYMQAKSNSFLGWAMGWALLALLSVNGLTVLFSILGIVMILAFIMRL
jgi:hypothetical protein